MNGIEYFDGELLHPSLEIKNGILILGFRYAAKDRTTKEIFIQDYKGTTSILEQDSLSLDEKTYLLDKRKRQLARIEERWGIERLKLFLDDQKNLTSEKTNMPELFGETLSLLKRYISLENEISYRLLAAWIIGTYFFPIFGSYPFLHLKAPKGSGKSQTLALLSQLCFNAVKARPSMAALGDTVDALRGTYLIDQADSLARPGREDLLDLLTDSYKKGGGKRRIINMDRTKGREVLEFETYGPKALASIKELPEDLRDRCLIVQLIRSKNNFPDPDDRPDWNEVRDMFYKNLILNHRTIASDYVFKKIGYAKNIEIFGRALDLWLPLEIILMSCGQTEPLNEERGYFLSQYSAYSKFEVSEFEEAIIHTIIRLIGEAESARLTPHVIAQNIDQLLFQSGEDPKQRASKVGRVIKQLNLSSEKGRNSDGVVYVFLKDTALKIRDGYCGMMDNPTSPALVVKPG